MLKNSVETFAEPLADKPRNGSLNTEGLWLYSGESLVFNTADLPGTHDQNYNYQPHQSWTGRQHDLTKGLGFYLRAEEGSWHIDLFTFDETEPPQVDDFDLRKWDWKGFGATEGHREFFFGRLDLKNYGESTSLHLVTPDKLQYKQEKDATYTGKHILIYAGEANQWSRKPSVGEGKVRSHRDPGKPLHVATRLVADADKLLQLVDQVSRDRLSDGDRNLLWKVIEERLTALAEAKVARELFNADLEARYPSKPQGEGNLSTSIAGALGALIKRLRV